jgi:hypothetical protein
MIHSMKSLLCFSAIGLFTSALAFASPTFDTFGALPAATFGGSGNPNAAVAITTSGSLTLGLAAQQRYFNPALTNDGAGTFFATAGQNDGLAGKSQGALWNFDYYINNTTTAEADPFTYTLEYGRVGGTVYSLNPLGIADNGTVSGFGGQNSQNLSFPFYGTLAGFQFNNFALSGDFDPAVNAVYQFDLIAKDANLTEQARVGILVNVSGGSSVPDGGSSCLLVGVALLGLVGFRRKFLG